MAETPGDRLRAAREKRFSSAREAALTCDWVVSTYTSHENGTRSFDAKTAKKYARAFGVDWLWLWMGIDVKVPLSDAQLAAVQIIGHMQPGTQQQALAILQALASEPDEAAS